MFVISLMVFVGVEPVDIDLQVEVPDVTDDGVVGHLLHEDVRG